MNLSLSGRLILVVVFVASETTFSSRAEYTLHAIESRQRPLLRNAKSTICPTPYFANGMIRIRRRGKFLIFECLDEFTLVGDKYSVCKEGRWTSLAPICVKSGCQEFPTVENGIINYENEKAAATLFCSSNYQLAGSMYSYCNGTVWDRAIGNCRKTGQAVQTSCDFEVTDWCGWENEATHEFGWKRSAGVVSKQILKTGPKHDHTTGVSLSGHFIMIDSAEQFTNATAHLYSPIYPANYSVDACFLFYYHMYGDSVGRLAVYIKPLSTDLKEIKGAQQFSISRSQGNVWNEGYFDLPAQQESFQIVFEATLGMRYKSNMAIDDVSLQSGEYCAGNGATAAPSVSVIPDSEEVFKIDSCENRCGKNISYQVDGASDQYVIHCDCYEGCIDKSSCCPDFAERCVLNVLNVTNVDVLQDEMLNGTASTSQPTTDNFEEDWSSSGFPTQAAVLNSHPTNRLIKPTQVGRNWTHAILFIGICAVVFGVSGTVIHIRRSSGILIIKQRLLRHSEGRVDALEDVRFLAVNEELDYSISEECDSVADEPSY